jgi:hypothetical protein
MKNEIFKVITEYLVPGHKLISSVDELDKILDRKKDDIMYEDICDLRDQLKVLEKYPGYNDRGIYQRANVIFLGLIGKINDRTISDKERIFHALLNENIFAKAASRNSSSAPPLRM